MVMTSCQMDFHEKLCTYDIHAYKIKVQQANVFLLQPVKNGLKSLLFSLVWDFVNFVLMHY